MKYYIIAGEASGDLHGRNLMNAIKKQDDQAQFRVWGGDLMKEAGAELVSHYKERAYMGFLEVILHLKKILGFIDQCKADLIKYQSAEPSRIIIFIPKAIFSNASSNVKHSWSVEMPAD